MSYDKAFVAVNFFIMGLNVPFIFMSDSWALNLAAASFALAIGLHFLYKKD